MHVFTNTASIIPIHTTSLLKKVQRFITTPMNRLNTDQFVANNKNLYEKIGVINHQIFGEVHQYKLKNGHKVYIIPKKNTEFVSTITHINQPPGHILNVDHDTAHLLEHLLVNRPQYLKTLTQDYSKVAMHIGGVTYPSGVIYRTTSHQKDFWKVFKFFNKRLKHPKISDRNLQREKETILHEALIKRADRNYTHSNNTILTAPTSHPEETIPRITKKNLKKYHKTTYLPSNMSTYILGDLKPDQIINQTAHHLKTKTIMSLESSPIQHTIDKTIEAQLKHFHPLNSIKFHPNADIGLLSYRIIHPVESNPQQCFTRMVLNKMLEDKLNSNNLITASEVSSEYIAQYLDSTNIKIIFKPTKNIRTQLATIKEQIHQTLTNMMEDPTLPLQVDNNKKQALNSLIFHREALTIEKLPDLIGSFKDMGLNLEQTQNIFDALKQITPEDIAKVTQGYLNQTPIMMTSLPSQFKNHLEVFPSLSFKGNPLSPQKELLKNGIEVITLNKPDTKLLTLTISIHKGYEQSNYTNYKLLEELLNNFLATHNTLNHDASKILVTSTPDFFYVHAQCLPDKQKELFESLNHLIHKPELKQEIFKNIKEHNFRNIEQFCTTEMAKTQDILQNQFYGHLDSRNTSPVKQLTDLKTATLEKIESLYKALWVPKHIKVSMIGANLANDPVQNYLAHILEKFPQASLPQAPGSSHLPQKPSIERTQILNLYTKIKGNAFLHRVFSAPTLNDRDSAAITLTRNILVSSPTRLFHKLPGYVKNINYQATQNSGLFEIMTSLPNTMVNIPKLNKIIDTELKKLAYFKVSKKDFDFIKKKFLHAEEIRNQNALHLSSFLVENSPFKKDSKSVTRQDIKRIAKEYFTKPYVQINVLPESLSTSNVVSTAKKCLKTIL